LWITYVDEIVKFLLDKKFLKRKNFVGRIEERSKNFEKTPAVTVLDERKNFNNPLKFID